MIRRLREHARALFHAAFREVWLDRSPLERGLLATVLFVHGLGLWWGLPGSEGWDVDAIAPRDFLPGVVLTFTPGKYFTYPPTHLLLLTLLTLPVTLVELLRAPSLAPHDLVTAFIDVRVMTAFAVVARLVNLVMSVGIVAIMGRLSALLFGPRARAWVLAIAGFEAACTYYGHTSNLDVPALFWASSALLVLAEALVADDEKRLRKVGLLAALAISTKDQAYAVFAVSMPVLLGAWLGARLRRRERPLDLAKRIVELGVLTPALTLLLDGALFNPTGFLARVHFLTGHASQDFAQYANDRAGRISAFLDAVGFVPFHYPWIVGPLFVGGLVVAAFRGARAPEPNRLVVAVLPALGMLSFTLTFNCVARRVEERFMLPQMQLLSVYAGGLLAVACAALEDRFGRWAAWPVRLGGLLVVALGLRFALTIDMNILRDPRYDAEAWMRAHTQPGDLIETYGNNVYLPRFPAGTVVQRIGPTPPASRNPMPDIVEKQEPYGDLLRRDPKLVVLSQCFVWRYVQQPRGEVQGRIMPKAQQVELEDQDATRYFHGLFQGATPYRQVHHSMYPEDALFPMHPMHASLGCEIHVFSKTR